MRAMFSDFKEDQSKQLDELREVVGDIKEQVNKEKDSEEKHKNSGNENHSS